MREIDKKALRSQNDSEFLEEFIREYEGFIIKAARKTTGSFISKSDDQWSVSLSAFHEAIKMYSFDKGAFLPFAELVIRRRLFDYVRKESRHFNELSIEELSIKREESGTTRPEPALSEKMTSQDNQDVVLEIQAVVQTLQEYGFSFFDLAAVSPKSEKTKTACGIAIAFLARSSILVEEMRRTKTLPLKIIEKNCEIPRKILERHRKYIIAGTEIIAGDYPILAEYFSYVKRGRSI